MGVDHGFLCPLVFCGYWLWHFLRDLSRRWSLEANIEMNSSISGIAVGRFAWVRVRIHIGGGNAKCPFLLGKGSVVKFGG